MPNLSVIAKQLRKHQTDTERFLWRHLRAKQIEGVKFRRQQPIGHYIVDFVSFEQKIIIELDGSQHAAAKDEDEKRDRWFRSQDYKVLRFWNNEVFQNIEGVLGTIRETCLEHPPPAPPIKGGEVTRVGYQS